MAGEKNSTLVMPVPVELLRFFDRASPAAAQAQPPAGEAQDTGAPLPLSASAPPYEEAPALPVTLAICSRTRAPTSLIRRSRSS
jgi:hypothetical protein